MCFGPFVNQNESGVHYIPSDIGDEIESDYERDPTDEESQSMDDFDSRWKMVMYHVKDFVLFLRYLAGDPAIKRL
jgi:hypothetical protein